MLRDEGEAFANKLRDAGVPVTAVRYQGTIHDFVMLNALAGTHAARSCRGSGGRDSPPGTESIERIRTTMGFSPPVRFHGNRSEAILVIVAVRQPESVKSPVGIAGRD